MSNLQPPSFDTVMELTSTISSDTAFSRPECFYYYQELCKLAPRSNILEIGLQFGRSSSVALAVATAKEHWYIGIDPFIQPPEAEKEWWDLSLKFPDAFVLLYTEYSGDVTDLPKLDLALIDGDHSAVGVETDCALVMPIMNPGGTIMFHDYGQDSLPDVWATVQRMMTGQPFVELATIGTLGAWRRM